MKTLLLSISLLLFCGLAYAQNAAEDYEELSRISPEKLMEEGRFYFEKRQPEKALSRFMIVSELYKNSKDKELLELSARALNNAGCVYKYFYYDYPQAYEYLNRSYALCEEINYDKFLPVVMVNMGDLLNDYGNTYESETVLKEAEAIFKECFKKSVKTKDWNLLTTAFYNISNLNYQINLRDYDAIFSKNIPQDTPDIQFIRLQYAGIKYIQEGNYAKARDTFEKQFAVINTPWEPARDTIATLINIAETYRLENKFKEAAFSFEKALDISDRTQNIELSAYIANLLTQCFQSLKDSTNADKYNQIYLANKERLNDSRLSNIGELKYISDLRKEERKASEIAARNRNFRYMIFALLIVIISILVSTIVILRKNRVLKSRNLSLYNQYQRLLENENLQKKSRNVTANLNDSTRETLIKKIGEVLEDDSLVCDEEFSLKQLAALVDSNTTYVSKVINEAYGESFSALLGRSRIKIACRRISDDKVYLTLTVEAIARSVGFKSRTAFLNAFKREVGITPSQFIKLASQQRKEQE